MNNTTNGMVKDYIYNRAMYRELNVYSYLSNMNILSEMFFRLSGLDLDEAADAYLAAHN